MKVTNAIKKLEKNGFEVTESTYNPGIFYATKPGTDHYVEFIRNGDSEDVAVISTVKGTAAGEDNYYSPSSTIKSAINWIDYTIERNADTEKYSVPA